MTSLAHPRILIAEDYPIFVLGLCQVLERAGSVCGIIAQGDAVADACRQQQPDLLILDLSLPGLSGMRLLRAVRKAARQVRIVVLSTIADADLADACLREGACGFVVKSVEPAELLRVIRVVLKGKAMTAFGQATHASERKQARIRAVTRLTPRLREVLELMGRGFNTPQIAARLGISRRTGEHHRGELYRRLGVQRASKLHHLAVEYANTLEVEHPSLPKGS